MSMTKPTESLVNDTNFLAITVEAQKEIEAIAKVIELEGRSYTTKDSRILEVCGTLLEMVKYLRERDSEKT
jgi:hypothetical protein